MLYTFGLVIPSNNNTIVHNKFIMLVLVRPLTLLYSVRLQFNCMDYLHYKEYKNRSLKNILSLVMPTRFYKLVKHLNTGNKQCDYLFIIHLYLKTKITNTLDFSRKHISTRLTQSSSLNTNFLRFSL